MGTITRNFANNIVTGGKVDGTDGLTGTIPASNVANDTLGNLTAFPATVGDFVEVTASDVPASPSTLGQLFYNSTSGTLKGVQTLGAWSSGGNMSTARSSGAGAGASVSSGLVFGGGSTPVRNLSEEYDGTSWTAGGNLGTARYRIAGVGTQTASLATGGEVQPGSIPTPATEEYNGTSWTSGGGFPVGVQRIQMAGTQTAAVAGGANGNFPPSYLTNTSAEYNGTSWTGTGSVNTARYGGGGAGSQTAGVIFAGRTPSPQALTEEYNGSSWTSVNNMNTARAPISSAVQAPQTDALGFAAGTATENYDGTSWSTNPATLSISSGDRAGFGVSTSAVAAGGYDGGDITTTEEYAFSAANVTLTTS